MFLLPHTVILLPDTVVIEGTGTATHTHDTDYYLARQLVYTEDGEIPTDWRLTATDMAMVASTPWYARQPLPDTGAVPDDHYLDTDRIDSYVTSHVEHFERVKAEEEAGAAKRQAILEAAAAT